MKNILQITMIGLAVLLSISAFGQKNHPHHRPHHNSILSMTEELQLTDEQVEQITAIQEKYKEQIHALRDKKRDDSSAKRGEVRELQEAQLDEIHAVLNADQKAKVEEKKAERKEAWKERKDQRANIDREGLRKAMKEYNEQEVLPVLKTQRAKLEDQIETEDKAIIAELREKFDNVHQRMQKERKERPEGARKGRGHKKGKNFKGFREDENPDREQLKSLVKKYDEKIEPLLNELKPQQEKWHEDMKKIAEQYIPKPEAAEGQKHHMHKRQARPGMKTMHKGHFLLLDPDAPAEAITAAEPALAEMIVYPNPATSANTLQYNVKKAGQVRIELRTKGGNILKLLLNEYKEVGEYNLDVNISDLESGIYFYTLIDQQGVTSKKVVVSK